MTSRGSPCRRLVVHGDSDAIVPLEKSGQRTHAQVAGSELHVIADGPHGINASHAEEFNRVLLAFLRADPPRPAPSDVATAQSKSSAV